MVKTAFSSLSDALRLPDAPVKPVVALVGGGGKTTALFMLAGELAARGKRVVTTTTTRLYGGQGAQSPAWCAIDDPRLGAMLDRHNQCLVTAAGDLDAGGKIEGLSIEQVTSLYERDDVDAVLIEADGSRRHSFKAPAPHEPVIPPQATHVLLTVGADIFGKPLDATHVHRPERVTALAGGEPGDIVTPDIVARVLTHAEGGFYRVPDAALVIPFFNKVEDPADRIQAEMAARLLLEHDRVREVLVGSLHASTFERWGRTAGVVLAAGMATRFGGTKQLLPWRAGTLVGYVTERLLDVCDAVLVVVGHEAEAVGQAVAHLPVEIIFNPAFEEGQGTSVAEAARALLAYNRPYYSEIFFAVADHPFLERALLEELQAARGTHRFAIPRHHNRPGNPVLFDSSLLPALAALTGDTGGRALFGRHPDDIAWVEVEDEKLLMDIDTAQEWNAIREPVR